MSSQARFINTSVQMTCHMHNSLHIRSHCKRLILSATRARGPPAKLVSWEMRASMSFQYQYAQLTYGKIQIIIMYFSRTYRVVPKSWRQVARKFQPSYSQPRPAMPGWCLTKLSLFCTQCCRLLTYVDGFSILYVLANCKI